MTCDGKLRAATAKTGNGGSRSARCVRTHLCVLRIEGNYMPRELSRQRHAFIESRGSTVGTFDLLRQDVERSAHFREAFGVVAQPGGTQAGFHFGELIAECGHFKLQTLAHRILVRTSETEATDSDCHRSPTIGGEPGQFVPEDNQGGQERQANRPADGKSRFSIGGPGNSGRCHGSNEIHRHIRKR